MSFDITIHNGTIVTASPDFDIIKDGYGYKKEIMS